MMATEPPGTVVLVNPLGAALAHYEEAFRDVVRAAGARIVVHSLVEPSSSGERRVRYLAKYLWMLLRARRTAALSGRAVVVVSWPVLHYLDVVLVRILGGRRAWVVFHDPRPLVRTTGAGAASLRVARLVRYWRVLSHSGVARSHLVADVGADRVADMPVVPLPLRDMTTQAAERPNQPVVRVLGQFKPDRDVSGLASLSRSAPPEWRLEVLGRGWPDIEGWHVESRFLSESELETAMRTASVVVIPYNRFYQSDIAARCLEEGTPFVGPRNSTLAEYGPSVVPLLAVDSSDWVRAVAEAISLPRAEVASTARDIQANVVAAYGAWLASVR